VVRAIRGLAFLTFTILSCNR